MISYSDFEWITYSEILLIFDVQIFTDYLYTIRLYTHTPFSVKFKYFTNILKHFIST